MFRVFKRGSQGGGNDRKIGREMAILRTKMGSSEKEARAVRKEADNIKAASNNARVSFNLIRMNRLKQEEQNCHLLQLEKQMQEVKKFCILESIPQHEKVIR